MTQAFAEGEVIPSHYSVELFKIALEAVPAGMLMVAADGHIVLANWHVERLFGYARGELQGLPIEVLIPERFRHKHPGFRAGFFDTPSSRPMGCGPDLYGLRKDGFEIPIEIGLNPVVTSEGTFVLSSVVDLTERKRAMEQFRLALEAAPTGMLMVDVEGKIVLVNAQVERLFGYPREDLVGQPMEILVPPCSRYFHPAFRKKFTADPRARPMGAGRDLYGLHKDGREIPIEIGLNPLSTPAGEFVLSSVADITQRKNAERENQALMAQLQQLNMELEVRVNARTRELTGALREREVLLQEIHHRVKNNLQVISSLIGMKMRRLEPGESRDALEDCQLRVQAIALIHEKLYKSKDYDRIPFSDYARSLISNILLLAEASSRAIALELAIEELTFPIDRAIPCGLILNELVTNAMKHAFCDGRDGRIRVELGRSQDGLVFLAVKDNGVGLTNPAPGSRDAMGLQLVNTLAEQLEARVEVAQDEGTEVRLCFALD